MTVHLVEKATGKVVGDFDNETQAAAEVARLHQIALEKKVPPLQLPKYRIEAGPSPAKRLAELGPKRQGI